MNDIDPNHEQINPFSLLFQAINWKSFFIWTIIGIQFVIFIITLFSLKYRKIRIPLIIIEFILAFSSQYIAQYCYDHSDKFDDPNIFDETGFFFFIFWGIPLFFDIVIVIISLIGDLISILSNNIKHPQHHEKIKKD